MKTTLKYVGLTIQYAFTFAIKFLRAFLIVAFSPEVMKGSIEDDHRKNLERKYRANNFDPKYHPDNLNNPLKRQKSW